MKDTQVDQAGYNDIPTHSTAAGADRSKVDIFRCIYGEEDVRENAYIRRDARDRYAENIYC